MSKATDIRVAGARLYFIPIQMRVPLKFGPETVTSVTCARACVRVADRQGRTAEGWGETPLSVQWVWPGKLAYEPRLETLKRFCVMLAEAWTGFEVFGHPIEVGHEFQEQILPRLLQETNLVAVESLDLEIPAGEFWDWAFHPEVLSLLCRFREGLLAKCETDARLALRDSLPKPSVKVRTLFMTVAPPFRVQPLPVALGL